MGTVRAGSVEKGRGNLQPATRNPQSESTAYAVEDSTPVFRPWGSYRTIGSGPGYKIKQLVIQPGQRLSLQKHRHRSEHWVVAAGTPRILVGEEVFTLRLRQCVTIPRGAWHRIENRGKVPVVIIELQHGDVLDEADIIRKQDDYGRVG
jgi:mannose-6-phosphate isomerase-like protein (cupin superfamily)